MTEMLKKHGRKVQIVSPWIAVVLAVVGWLESRDQAKDAQVAASNANKNTTVEVQAASTTQQIKAHNRWVWVRKSYLYQQNRIDYLEEELEALNEFVEEMAEHNTPDSRRERRDHEARLRSRRRARGGRMSRPAAALPDFDVAQAFNPENPLKMFDLETQ